MRHTLEYLQSSHKYELYIVKNGVDASNININVK